MRDEVLIVALRRLQEFMEDPQPDSSSWQSMRNDAARDVRLLLDDRLPPDPKPGDPADAARLREALRDATRMLIVAREAMTRQRRERTEELGNITHPSVKRLQLEALSLDAAVARARKALQ